jgi:Transposase DDE domain/Insertion element 4 transposase N-terminal
VREVISGIIYGITKGGYEMSTNLAVMEPIVNTGTIGLAQLSRIFPLPVVKQALEQTGKATWRLRQLPSELMFYFPLMMPFDRTDSASETLRKLLEGHSGIFGRRTDDVTGKAGISAARIRVGYEPLEAVYRICCKPLVRKDQPYSHSGGLRLVALDAALINVPDTDTNTAHFQKSENQNGKPSAYPKARLLALVECGTHAVVAAEIGTYKDSEITMAHALIHQIEDDMLVLADRLYFGWELFNEVHDTGAKILWRIKSGDQNKIELQDRLPDGSYTGIYTVPRSIVRKTVPGKRQEDFERIPVRVCAYNVDGQAKEDIFIVTTLLDHATFPAKKIAELYLQRWEIELVFREMKVELNKNATALRSLTPALVMQELYGLLMTHYAIRNIIYEAALAANLDPDVISFKGTVKAIARKSLKGGSFPPSRDPEAGDKRDTEG